MMSSAATSSPVSASTLAYLMRWPVLRLIWLKLTFSVSDVAGYRATGQVTSERRKKPFQFARGAMGYSEYAADDRPRYHRGTRIQGEREGNLPLALTGAGPVGCKRTPSALASPASRELTSAQKSGTSFSIMRLLQHARRQAFVTSVNRGHHGNATPAPDRRNPDRSTPGRTGTVGACPPDRLDRACGIDPRRHLVRVLPHLSGTRVGYSQAV